MKHITKIILGAAFLIIGGVAVMGNGQKNQNLSAVSDVKRADAAIKTPGPFWTMAPDEQRYINYRKDGLRTMPWWKEHTLANGMTIYEKCLVDAGKTVSI